MQNKILKITVTKSNDRTIITLPDPERHAALSDDFSGDDWAMFASAKSAIQTHGARFNGDLRCWVIANNRDHSALIEKLLNIAAYALWEVKATATIRTTYPAFDGQVEAEVIEAPKAEREFAPTAIDKSLVEQCSKNDGLKSGTLKMYKNLLTASNPIAQARASWFITQLGD